MQLEEVGRYFYIYLSSIAIERIERSLVISSIKRFS